MIKRFLLKLSILIFCLSLPLANITNAVFTDSAQINNNHFTSGDWTPPSTTFTTSNSLERTIEETVLNPDFNDDLNNWLTNGDVEVIQEEAFDSDDDSVDDLFINPNDIPGTEDNDNMAVVRPSTALSGYDADGYELYYSSLSQEIPNSAKTLSFWYNFLTTDASIFDSPGFLVFLNGQEIYQLWADDINPDYYNALAASGWRKFYYDLSSIDIGENPNLTLIFYSGNTIDQDFDSWVYLDKISTSDIVAFPNTKLYLTSYDSQSEAQAWFKRGGCQSGAIEELYTYGSYPEGGFSLDQATLDNKFCYWSEDGAGNVEESTEILLIFDDQAPEAIVNLKSANEGYGRYELSWTVPNDDGSNIIAYDIRYKDSEVTGESDWDLMNSLADLIAIPGPKETGTEQSLVIDEDNLDSNSHYWFAAKTVDSAGNWSAISNIATDKILITEIYYHPFGNEPDEEWIELYNATDETIDLSVYKIGDEEINGGGEGMYQFPSGSSFEPDDFIIIANKAASFNSLYGFNPDYEFINSDPTVQDMIKYSVWAGGSVSLANSEDEVLLLNENDEIVDLVAWGGSERFGVVPHAGVSEGSYLTRKNKYLDTDDCSFDFEEKFDPSPGTNPHSKVTTTLNFYPAEDKKSVGFEIKGIKYWQKLHYRIIYNSEQGEQAVLGSLDISEGENSLKKEDFKLGTCSSEGAVCIYHTGIEKIDLTITLIGSGIPDRILQKSIVFE